MAGGRMTFERQQPVRLLKLDGRISTDAYTIVTERADRKGHIVVAEVVTGREIKVNQRRVLADSANGEAFVIQVSDRYRAVCPLCSEVVDVAPNNDTMECSTHGVFKLSWRQGERPMADTTTEKPKTPKAPKAERKPSPEKKQKAVREPVKVDLAELGQLKHCELWTKGNVHFDHEKINVQAHVLLFVDGAPRKLCFNTYDGTLGKKGVPLPIDDFCKNAQSNGKPAWFNVKDLDKARDKLTKDGYEKA